MIRTGFASHRSPVGLYTSDEDLRIREMFDDPRLSESEKDAMIQAALIEIQARRKRFHEHDVPQVEIPAFATTLRGRSFVAHTRKL